MASGECSNHRDGRASYNGGEHCNDEVGDCMWKGGDGVHNGSFEHVAGSLASGEGGDMGPAWSQPGWVEGEGSQSHTVCIQVARAGVAGA
jgi:hypothetical protein